MKKALLPLLLAGLCPATVRASPFYSWPQPGIRSRASTHLVYYGGPVIGNAKIYAVFWGDAVNAQVRNDIGGFYAALVDSTAMDWLKEYDTDGIMAVDGRPGTGQHIRRGSYGGAYPIVPSHSGRLIDDQDVRDELERQIRKGALPAPSADSVYMIHFPPNVTIAADGGTSCRDFCAYHEGFRSDALGAGVYYGVLPDQQANGCGMGCGGGRGLFDATTTVSSHELFEAITDPFPTPGSHPAYPQAWNTTDGEEIGDLCTFSAGRLNARARSYVVQGEWDNADDSCATGPYVGP